MKILKLKSIFIFYNFIYNCLQPTINYKIPIFGNIFAPFFDVIFGDNLEIYNAFAYHIRWSEGWISTPDEYSIYLRPFISFDISKLSSSLGLIFLLMLINFKLQRKQNSYLLF